MAPPRHRTKGIRELDDYQGPVLEHCDVLIVGSGPGGGLLARYLEGTNARVILVEAGPWLRPEDFVPDGGKTMASHFWNGGMRFTRGNIIMPTLQGRALGGTNVFNAAISMRASEQSLQRWAEDDGVQGLSAAELAPHYAAVEEFLGVRPVAASRQGRRNDLFREGCEALGWKAEPLPRNETGCVGSGECVTGCRSGAKQSPDRRGIPEFVAAGGEVFTSIEATKLVLRDGRVDGIEGYVVAPEGGARSHAVRISARVTVLAAGVLATPVICQRSGLTPPAIGGNLRLHPSGFLTGVFDEVVDPTFGATQGFHCLDFIDQGIKLESLWAPPSVFVRRFPSAAKQFSRYMTKIPNMAIFDGWIGGEDSVGRVRALPAGRVDYTYDIGTSDVRRLQEMNAKLAELMVAAGAKEVLPGIRGLPEIIRASSNPAAMIRDAKLDVKDLQTASNHLFGTMAMGANDGRHATDSDGKVYGVDDLYVCDTSLFPSSPAANPQLTAMALGRRLAGILPDRYGFKASASLADAEPVA